MVPMPFVTQYSISAECLSMRDYYLVLGVPRSSSRPAIRRAYLDLVRRLHPDRAGVGETARLQEINEAYETLSDPEKRRRYDRSQAPSEPIAPRAAAEPLAARRGRGVSDPLDVFEELGAVRPSAEALFERFMRNFVAGAVPKGKHLSAFNVGLILSAAEARRGVVVPLHLPVLAPCPACGGSGGWWLPCGRCSGMRLIPQERDLRIPLPGGVRDGMVVEVSLEPLGVQNLYVVLHVAVV